MRVGIISDTHGVLPDSIYSAFENVDRILHAGDIGSPSVLYELQSIAPVAAVLGNCDYSDISPDVGRISQPVIGGLRFKVVHKYKDLGFPDGDADVYVCGHTHEPNLVVKDGKYLINPGSASEPRGESGKSAAIVNVVDGKVFGVEFKQL
ncbi:MAG: metallophosphoesterase family protein [Coriobacteriales bacterium]|jgi:putative phosphoesterase